MADFFSNTPTSVDPGTSPRIDPRIVRAMIGTESSGNPNARGKAGEIGLMQIMPKTGQALGFSPESLSDPSTNVAAGTMLLNRLLSKYKGDIGKTLAAYNAGEGAVDRGQIPESTRRYVSNVLSRVGQNMPAMASAGASVPQGTLPGAARLLPLLSQLQMTASPRNQTLDLPQQTSSAAPTMPSMFERLKSAWSPGTAEAAEPPGLADEIARDKARRRGGTVAPVSVGGDPTPADIDAAKARRLGPDESKAPFLVKAAGWAPLVGQTIGEYGMGAADIGTTGPAAIATEPLAMGAGGAGGYGLGETLINRPIRSLYGYPNPSWGQEAKDIGVAGATSAAAVPATKILGKFLPASLKAGMQVATEEGPGRRAAQGALENVTSRFPSLPESSELADHLQRGTDWLQQLPSRASNMVRTINTMAQDKIPARIEALRNGMSTLITRVGETGTNDLERLARMRQVVASLPEDVMQRLYNMSPKDMTEFMDTTMKQHARWLQRPDLRVALKEAMDNTPYELRKYIGSHMNWARHWMIFKAFVNPIGALKDLLVTEVGGRTMIGGSKIVNSPIMRRMYLGLLSSQTPHQVRLLTRALINALITSQFTGMGQQPTVPRGSETPDVAASAAPAPAAAAAEPSTPASLPPAPPSDSTLEIDPAAAPTPDDSTE